MPKKKRPIARQLAWQQKQIEAGNCRNCGQPREHYAVYCDECVKKKHASKWKPGRRGRPPKWAKEDENA
jgi:predicted amidophosphoribosyltransferase